MAQDDYAFRRAKDKVDNIKGFYGHLAVYLLVNSALVVFNLATSPQHLWFFWPLGGWGIGLTVHFLGVFVMDGMFGKEWEERKIRKYMAKYESNDPTGGDAKN